MLAGEESESIKSIKCCQLQLQLASLSPDRLDQIDVLAELTSAVIHLQARCGDDFQELMTDELESIPSHDDAIDTNRSGSISNRAGRSEVDGAIPVTNPVSEPECQR